MSMLYWKSASVGSLLRTVIAERIFFIAVSCSLLQSPSLSLKQNDRGLWTGPAACTCVCEHTFCVTLHLLSLQSQPVYCRTARSAGQTSLRSERSSGHTHTEGLTVTVKNRVLKFSGSHLLPSEECFIHEVIRADRAFQVDLHSLHDKRPPWKLHLWEAYAVQKVKKKFFL